MPSPFDVPKYPLSRGKYELRTWATLLLLFLAIALTAVGLVTCKQWRATERSIKADLFEAHDRALHLTPGPHGEIPALFTTERLVQAYKDSHWGRAFRAYVSPRPVLVGSNALIAVVAIGEDRLLGVTAARAVREVEEDEFRAWNGVLVDMPTRSGGLQWK